MKKEQEAALQIPQETEEEIIVAEEESKGKRILNTVVNVILVIAIALAAVCTYASYVSTSGNGVPNILGVRIFSIQTESMYPTLLPGDLIFDTGVKEATELRKDDIITYWTVINGERVLNTHRIHEIYDGGGYLIFSTKGDNNTSADPLTVHESEIVGKYSFRIPGVGKVFDYLQTSTGFLIVIVIPVFLFFLFHLVQFFRVLFEYQNVKNRIKFEQERGRTEDLIDQEQKRQSEAQAAARLKMEEELRERLRAEIMASMAAQQAAAAPAAEEVPAKEEPSEEPAAEEAPAEETAEEAEEKVEEAAEEAADKTEENA
ncbi:MAG: signal peptidase I [Oscillospiraceae bacterium]|nr:signal peptidase I [Oscillospiraceae bacterium]